MTTSRDSQGSIEDLTDQQLDAVIAASAVLAATDGDCFRQFSNPETRLAAKRRNLLSRKSTLEKVKVLARKRIERTSIQTVPEILRAKSWEIRLAWLVLLTTAIVGCSYQIHAVVSDFISSPTATNIQFVRPEELEYPVLSICPLTERNLDERIVGPDMVSGKITRNYINAIEWGLGMVRPTDYLIWLYDRNDTAIDEAYQQAIHEHGTVVEARRDIQRRYGLTCWTFFRACYDQLSNYFNCCLAFEPVYRMNGLCFATKPGFLKARGGGNSEAMRFVAWNFARIEVAYTNDRPKSTERIPQKYVVGLMPNSRLDQTPQYQNLAYLDATETLLYHIKNKRVIRRKEAASGRCYEEQKLNVFRDFTFSNCQWERIFFEQLPVSCQLPMTALLSGENNVNNPCDLETIRRLYGMSEGQELLRYGYWELFNRQRVKTNCTQKLCESELFAHTVTRLAPDFSRKSADMDIQIQFDAFEIEVITEVQRLGFNDAIGVIGGIFGLWAGASIVSLVHFMAVCFSIAHEAFKAKFGKKLKVKRSIALNDVARKLTSIGDRARSSGQILGKRATSGQLMNKLLRRRAGSI